MLFFFFYSSSLTSTVYTLSLHDALPISSSTQLRTAVHDAVIAQQIIVKLVRNSNYARVFDNDQYFYQLSSIMRSEEHTSELQSRGHLVCRLLLEKKKQSIYL